MFQLCIYFLFELDFIWNTDKKLFYFSEEEIERNAELLPAAKVRTRDEEMIANLSEDVVDDLTLENLRYGLEGKF